MIPITSSRSVGRNRFDDDSDDEIEIFEQNTFIENISMKLDNFSLTSNPKLLLIINNTIASAAGRKIISHFSMNSIGWIEGSKKYGQVLANENLEIVVVVIKSDIPEPISYKISNTLVQMEPRMTVILDGYNASKVQRDSLNNSNIRYLQTSCVPEESSPKSLGVSHLDIGAVVCGLSAAVISQCEVRKLPAVICFSIREAAYTLSAAKSFEVIWPIIRKCLDDMSLPLPDSDDYMLVKRSDPFLINTENLYT